MIKTFLYAIAELTIVPYSKTRFFSAGAFALSALAFFVALYVIPLILLMGKGEMTKGTNS